MKKGEGAFYVPEAKHYITDFIRNYYKKRGIYMANINIELSGYLERVIDRMVEENYAKTKTEAIRLALFEFDQLHGLTDDELYALAAERMLKDIRSGKEKVHRFSLR